MAIENDGGLKAADGPFRRLFLEALQEAFDAGTLRFGASLEALRIQRPFSERRTTRKLKRTTTIGRAEGIK